MGTSYIIYVHVISKKRLKEHVKQYPDAKSQLETWYYEAKNASWKTPIDVKNKYGKASILKESRVVFDIKGKKYRLVVQINYAAEVINIRWFGTHDAYNKINAEVV